MLLFLSRNSYMMSLLVHICLWLVLVHAGTSTLVTSPRSRTVALDIVDLPVTMKDLPLAAKKQKPKYDPHHAKKAKSADFETVADNLSDANQAEISPGYSNYIAEIRNIILQRKTFPEYSKRLNEYGLVKLMVVINPDGQVRAVELAEACPFQRLNIAAVALIRGIHKFKPFPPELASHTELKLEIPIEYVIR